MKRIISNVMLVAAAATAFFSCQKQEVVVPETEQVSCLTFTSEKPAFADETKTEWTGETIQWSEGDKIRIAYTCDDVWQNADGTATASEEDGYKTAKFYASTELDEASGVAQFDVPGKFVGNAEGEYVFYGIYPSSLVGSSDMKNAPSFNVILPSVQTPLADSFDPESDVMVAQSDVYAGMPEEAVSLKWNRKVAHAYITLKEVNGISAEEQVISVKITAQETANMVGMQKYDMTTGEFIQHEDNAAANVLEINGANLSVENGNVVFWASFLPCTWESFTVELNTDKATYTRTVGTCNLEFKQNARNTLAIKMQDAEVAERVEEVTATLTFDNKSKRTEFTDAKQVWKENDIILTNNKANSTNNVADYAQPARFYKGSSVEVKTLGSITKIVFDCNSDAYATALKTSIGTVTGTVVSVSSDKVTVTFSSPLADFKVAKLSDQVRMDAVTVTYQTAGGSSENPDVTPELNVTETTLQIDYVKSSEVVSVSTKNLYDIEANAFADDECTSDCDWLAAEWTPEGISYTVTENTSNELRKGYIQITGLDLENNEYSEVITVSQATSNVAELTIKEFKAKDVHPYMWYQLTGVMSNIAEANAFGNFDLTDGTETVYVYGLTATKKTANDKSFNSLGLRNGDELTLIGTRAEYNSKVQVGGPAYYVDHVAAPYIEVTPTTINVNHDDTEARFTVDSNVEWEVVSEDVNDWDIADDGTVTVYFSENESEDEVQYEVTIKSELGEVVVTIVQAGDSVVVVKAWTLVTDASTLKAGDQIIIVAKDYNYAISTDQKSNNRGQAAVTKSGSTINEPGATVQKLTLEAGKSSGTFAFNTGSGYLYAASSSKNYLKTEKTMSANSSWSITIATNGTATVKATGSNTRNVMQYNQSSSLFACYSSASQKAIAIYRYE